MAPTWAIASRIRLPSLGATQGLSDRRWSAVISTVGYMAFMTFALIRALRARPDWRSGGAGDLIRFSRGRAIARAIAGLVLAPVLLVKTWGAGRPFLSEQCQPTRRPCSCGMQLVVARREELDGRATLRSVG
jgi:hypothetical protein